MYFIDVKNDKIVKILIRREMHLIDNFKINIFIDNDFTIPELIVIDYFKKKIVIDNCEITISFDVRTRINYVQQRFIYAKKIIVLSFRNQIIIVVHHFTKNLSNDRSFLFELNEFNFILYVHLIDFSI